MGKKPSDDKGLVAEMVEEAYREGYQDGFYNGDNGRGAEVEGMWNTSEARDKVTHLSPHTFTEDEMEEIKRRIGALQDFYGVTCGYIDGPTLDDKDLFGKVLVARSKVQELMGG